MTLVEYIREKFSEDILQQGVRQGLEQGLEKGLAEGVEKSKTEIARNMLSMGMDLKVISSATGLLSQEIKKLTH